MSGRSAVPGLLALAPLLGACAFLTDFPDVEARDGAGGAPSGGPASTGTTSGSTSDGGAGSTGTNGTAGGDPSSSGSTGAGGDGGGACGPCASCVEGEGTCPDRDDHQVVVAVDANQQEPRSIWINQIVEAGESDLLFVGHAATESFGGGFVETSGGAELVDFDAATGFVLDADGNLVVAAALCSTDGDLSEVFFNAATIVHASATPRLVIAGGFQGEWIHFHQGDYMASQEDGCPPAGEDAIDAADVASSTFPFLAWIQDGDLAAALPPSGGGTGYFADVVALPGEPDGGVAAIGVLEGQPFEAGPFLDAAGELAVVLAAPSATPEVTPLPEVFPLLRRPCNGDAHEGDLSGLRTSIAAESAELVWAAGTGCHPEALGPPDRSFLALVDVGPDPREPIATLNLGDTTSEVSVTDVAVDGDLVLLAGRYSGTPPINAYRVADPGDGDGFVTAFRRSTWTNQAVPLWFTRIAGEGDAVEIRDLHAVDGRIFVAGSFEDEVAVDGTSTCIDDEVLARRAFFAELDAEGALRWLRVDGFAAAGSTGASMSIGTAIGTSGDEVFIANRAEGELVRACGESSVGGDGRPLAAVRVLAP